MTEHEPSAPLADAALVSAAGSLPLPFVGGVLARAARGAAFRRVLRRHGLRFGPGARERLVAFEVGRPRLRGLLRRVPVLGGALRFEAGLATWVAARLLDDHLAGREVDGATVVVDVAEADKLARALEVSFEGGLAPELLEILGELLRLSGRSVAAPFRDDLEGRAPHLRLVDTLLDGLAELPQERFAAHRRRFEQALRAPGARS